MPDILRNHPLKDLNSFHLDVYAHQYCECASLAEIQEIISGGLLRKGPVLILGEGSNILFSGNYGGLIIRPLILGREIVKEDRHNVWIRAGAGENWDEFVEWCTLWGYGGLENLSLIPGSVGSGPIQNIGAYGVEVESCIEEVYAVDIQNGNKLTFHKEACRFAYRDSIFKHEWKDQCILTSILFRLSKKPKLNLSYGMVAERMDSFKRDPASRKGKKTELELLRQVIIDIRSSKLPDPDTLGNAGSFFKNPLVDNHKFAELLREYPDIPSYPQGRDSRKIPAAWLIEQCGWKGRRKGDAGSYGKQALVLVNYGNASGSDILELATEIENDVNRKFGIRLKKEVNVI